MADEAPRSPASPEAPPARRRPRPFARPAPAPPRRFDLRTGGLAQMLGVVAIVVVGLHLLVSRDEFSIVVRALLAIPAILFFWELNRYLKRDEPFELPFSVIGLAYYYGAFCWPSFFDIEFYDLSGRVHFSESSRLAGGVAIALCAMSLYGGFFAGREVGARGQPWLLRFLPSNEVPSGYPIAVLIYAALAFVMTVAQTAVLGLIPIQFAQVVTVTIGFDLLLGLTMVRREMFRGPLGRHVSTLALLTMAGFGILRGMLDPLFRSIVAFVSGRWTFGRKLPLFVIVAGMLTYVVLQPAKSDFRAQVWYGRNTEQQAGYQERLEAWGNALSRFWSREGTQEEATESSVTRISELEPVMHAFELLPGRVQSLDGEGWKYILTSPIPRLVWPDKPTTSDTMGRYGIAFNRQTEYSARSTAINLSLVVDGYWNLGWPGIAIGGFLIGLWLGICQRMFAAEHWAVQAIGMTWISRIAVHASLATIYTAIFQHMTGLILACWAIFGLSKLLSNQRGFSTQRGGVGPVPHRPIRRALPRA